MDSPIAQSATPTRRGMAFAFTLPVLLLLPFINRAYNIDEPMFIWVAQQVTRAPLDFFGGFVERSSGPQPMYEYNQNPPGFSYYLALFGAVGGWNEPVLHLASVLASGAFGLGTYLAASRLSARPLLAAVLAVLTPGFIVSATTVMTDVAMVACYVWAVYAWLRWMDTDRRGPLIASMALIVLGAFMKYYAITLVPLLGAYALAKRRPAGIWLGAFGVPVVALAMFFMYSRWRYGVNLLHLAAQVAQDPAVRDGTAPAYRAIVTLVFVGGCFAPVALYALFLLRPTAIAAWAAAVAAGCFFSIEGFPLVQILMGTSDHYSASLLLQLGLMLAAGGLLIALPLREVVRSRDAGALLLGLWVFGALVFTVFVNHLINARTLLPLSPAIAIVVARSLPPSPGRTLRVAHLAPLGFGALLSLGVAWGDYAVAEGGRFAASRSIARAERENAPLYYAGLWGFQYYLTQAGAKPFTVEGGGFGGEQRTKMPHGALLAVSSDSREKWRHAPERFQEVAFFAVYNPARIATYHPADQAGFYSHLSGILPYKFGLTSQEEYGLYRWLGPDYVPNETKR